MVPAMPLEVSKPMEVLGIDGDEKVPGRDRESAY
jgi:hypothetical protein